MPDDDKAKTPDLYAVRVKAGHPTGTYRRGGHVFTINEDTILHGRQLTKQIREDGWLVVRELGGEPVPVPAAPVADTEAVAALNGEIVALNQQLVTMTEERDAALAQLAAAAPPSDSTPPAATSASQGISAPLPASGEKKDAPQAK